MPYFPIYGYHIDIWVIPVLLTAVWAIIASARVNSTFKKYSKIKNVHGRTGAECAMAVLHAGGVYDVRVEKVSGKLTDHYDPKANVIRLSEEVYDSTSVAALGVAAHEAGHAVQHATGYFPIKIRTAIVPVCQIGSNLAMPLVLLGLILGALDLAYIGVALFGLAAVFQLVTLPVEFNASSRALNCLETEGILVGDEIKSARKVLSAAAMTYVAALAVSVLTLLRYIAIADRRRD